MIASCSPWKITQETRISTLSDVPVSDPEVCNFERSLKIDFSIANLILRFSTVLLDRLSCVTSQTIEKCFLYKTGYLPSSNHFSSIRKKIETQKTCMRGRSKFRSFSPKTIVKVQSARLKLSDMIALLTAHRLMSTLLSKFTRRSTNFCLQKLQSAMIFASEHTGTRFLSRRLRTRHSLDSATFFSSKGVINRRASCYPEKWCKWSESIALGWKSKNSLEQTFTDRERKAEWTVWRQ